MNKTENALILSRAELRTLLAHASKDATRDALWGLCVDVGRGLVIATDGHRLALLAHEGWPKEHWSIEGLADIPSASSVIVPRDQLEAANKACPAKGCVALRAVDQHIVVEVHAKELPSAEPMSTTRPLRVESQFPAVSQVLPPHSFETLKADDVRAARDAVVRLGGEPAEARSLASAAAYTPRYLIDALEFVATQEPWRRDASALIVTPTHSLDPLVVRFGFALALVMPKRM